MPYRKLAALLLALTLLACDSSLPTAAPTTSTESAVVSPPMRKWAKTPGLPSPR